MSRYCVVEGEKALRDMLGRSCSPHGNYGFYVVGPDARGRLCHVASCRNRFEARTRAERLNGSTKNQ